MSKYKVGDVAALFSQPKEATTESGKKLQSLFQEFHKKNNKNYIPSYQRNAEKTENNVEEGNGKIQNQGFLKKEKKRKFSAANPESNVEDINSKKFKKTNKQEETEPIKHNQKHHFLSEQNFPRKKKLSKAKAGNLNNDSFNELNENKTAFSGNKPVSDAIFKSKDEKQASSFIRKSKKQRQAALNDNIKRKNNEEMSNVETKTNGTLFKDESEKFTKRNDKKTKKRKFCDNLIQNAEPDQNLFAESQDSKKSTKTPEEDSLSDASFKREVKDFIRSAKKKSFGGNHKQNSQPKLHAEGGPGFIKIPELNSNDYEERLKYAAETNGTLSKDESEKFTKRKDKKSKKKKFCDDNLLQNVESDQNLFDESQDSKKCTKTPQEESSVSDTSFKRDFIRSAKKKSFGGNHKQNSQPKLHAEGEPDFIKIPGLNSKDDDERLKRTVFVGNLPVNTKKKALRTLFSPFGEIEQVRFHGIETDKAKIFGEDASKTLNPNNFAADSLPGFIVFADRQSAGNALSLSGSLFRGNHITVDFALPAGSKKLYDDKRSVFIGNLPFDCKDESIWDAFSECGRIESVRVVKDKKTGIGKGFGYVQFSTVQAKENALALEDLNIQGRPIRIKTVETSRTAQKKTNNPPPVKKINTFKSRAINIKKKNKDSGSRKSVKKIMQKQKMLHNKKKVANILQKSMKL